MDFNEDKAIEYIIAKLGDGYADTDPDEILNIIDIIWDYYEENGLLDIDMGDDDDEELDVDALLTYVKKTAARDHSCPFNSEEVERIVRAELEYEDQAF